MMKRVFNYELREFSRIMSSTNLFIFQQIMQITCYSLLSLRPPVQNINTRDVLA